MTEAQTKNIEDLILRELRAGGSIESARRLLKKRPLPGVELGEIWRVARDLYFDLKLDYGRSAGYRLTAGSVRTCHIQGDKSRRL